jgi:PAS domain S-box-containing protein
MWRVLSRLHIGSAMTLAPATHPFLRRQRRSQGWGVLAGAAAGPAAPPDERVVAAVVRARAQAALLAAAACALALLGWLLDSEILKAWVHGHTAMKTNTVVGALALALSVWLFERRPRISAVLAAFAAAVGLLSSAEIAFHVDFGIDQLLAHEAAGATATSSPNLMAPNSAALLVMLGGAHLFLRSRLAAFGHALALLGFGLALLGVIGQATGTEHLISLGHSTTLSIPAAFAFVLLAYAAVFSRLDAGVARLFVRSGFEGLVLRYSLVAALAVPIVLGFCRTGLHGLGVDNQTAEWLYTVAIIAVLVGSAALTVRMLGTALGAFTAASDRLQAVVEYSPLAVVTLDPNLAVTSWNPSAERLFGWSEEELLGKPYPLVTDEDWDEVVAEAQETRMGSTVIADHKRRRKDGTEVVVQVAHAPLTAPDGGVRGMSLVIRDVTEQRQAEEALRRVNAELEQRVAERTAELTAANRGLQAFSYSVSHDLRSPLRALDGFSQALLEDYGPQLDETARDHLGRIRGASQRMAELIDDVLRLSRATRADLKRERVDVSAVARSVAAELALADPDREVDVQVEDGLVADADPQLFRVALQNLLENAWKFTRDAEAPRVEVAAAKLDGRAGFSVSDNGAGFPEQYRDKLFRPFQRLHATADFPGNGIGLATVFNIVQRHGGSVRAESPAGGGARFTITFGMEASR